MITVKVTLENGNYFYTGINATLEEAVRYYERASPLNMGVEGDDMQEVTSVEEVIR